MSFIKFLGTAGARIVMAKQLRGSAGIWLDLDGTNIYLDPGPGALVKCWSSKPKLDPSTLDGIVLSHKHLDHSGDINAMIEAMTEGGHKKKGTVLCPKDALLNDPVILKYVRSYLKEIKTIRKGKKIKIKDVTIDAPSRHTHGVETYGLTFESKKHTISYITDTRFFPELPSLYKKSDVLILGVLKPQPSELDHLSLEDARIIIKKTKPGVAILTHFGMQMIKSRPWEIAEKLSKELKTKIIAASDGMKYELS